MSNSSCAPEQVCELISNLHQKDIGTEEWTVSAEMNDFDLLRR
ncbi:hypothetical protein [Pedobacter sp. N36a]|nr:hypothetical protein [Pedobacter sp. N36a]